MSTAFKPLIRNALSMFLSQNVSRILYMATLCFMSVSNLVGSEIYRAVPYPLVFEVNNL